ncbi:hypothetical protein HBH56_203280 [Parastagonospora nodorum]|uniref:Uncharacterized protein n=1 Tax=Phaeosphaeria nodorum (strain SN15 / ATCC MYA-4574 / FGSC 10173) TaxID=321614 RepID=A0A7U2FB10_PHANO|nr:hypothetical protein HBH56_203280 [Parastagonospora nodorum]QRD01738.1 hypothetical protein JI435_417200 [Parastagonospora nodorum SN15]KAH3923961.1 hypothetical protein HBH54_202150 [Parastagonospora nodorum]KAH3959498.1 hypothetical protein HBH51_198610 [Parastagonospora nodorum]KAH3963952.1 hypothetical protein HBH52_214990 [Parastagonospora nodorum]
MSSLALLRKQLCRNRNRNKDSNNRRRATLNHLACPHKTKARTETKLCQTTEHFCRITHAGCLAVRPSGLNPAPSSCRAPRSRLCHVTLSMRHTAHAGNSILPICAALGVILLCSPVLLFQDARLGSTGFFLLSFFSRQSVIESW